MSIVWSGGGCRPSGFIGGEPAPRCSTRAATFEEHREELFSLCIREGGKTLPDAVLEVREAVDFLRYYASEARAKFTRPQVLPGPTGELNELRLHGRGVFACISPWNFPLAIFIGPVAAALAAGNTAIAKPAEQTPLIGALASMLDHEAGSHRCPFSSRLATARLGRLDVTSLLGAWPLPGRPRPRA